MANGVRERGATLGLAPALPGLLLVIVIFWALAAVLMLTGTLINAREIEDDVAVINNQVTPIDEDLDNIKLAAETNRIATRIREAATPLTGQLDDVISAAQSIDRRASSILATAGDINETAVAINANVTSIGGSVVSIHDTVQSIGANVDSIHGTVRSIFANVVNIFSTVGPAGATDRSIRGNVRRILRTFVALRPEVNSIDRGVSAINRRADRAADVVRGLHSDLSRVDTQVGVNHRSGSGFGIHGHANSIDCALGGSYCGQ